VILTNERRKPKKDEGEGRKEGRKEGWTISTISVLSFLPDKQNNTQKVLHRPKSVHSSAPKDVERQ